MLRLVQRFIKIDGNSEQKVYEGAAGDFVGGIDLGYSYRVVYTVEDNCGNSGSAEYSITTTDEVAPVAVCDDELNVMLNNQGIGRVSADAVDEGSWDNCGLAEILLSRELASQAILDAYLEQIQGISFDMLALDETATDKDLNASSEIWVLKTTGKEILRKKDGKWFSWWSDAIWFTCEDQSTQVITELLVIDQAGLTNMCWMVEDIFFDHCEDVVAPALISGSLLTEEGVPVEFVDVNLTGGMVRNSVTGQDGQYHFNELIPGADYTITPYRNDDHLNGVNTLDLIHVLDHILGIEYMDNPYHLIAADADASGSISALDLIHIRKLILEDFDELPNNYSWRFIPKNFVFPDRDNPWVGSIPEVLNFNDVRGPIEQADFVALKIADLDGSAAPNSQIAEDRSTRGTFNLQAENLQLKQGREYRVAFTSSEFSEVLGFQSTINFNLEALDLVRIENGLLKEEHFGTRFVEEGSITCSWNKTLDQSNPDADPELFAFIFRARQDALLSDLIHITSRRTRAEAYSNSRELLEVALQFESDKEMGDSFQLFQNVPNPWREQTRIGFHLPQRDRVSFVLRDVQGRVLKESEREYEAGYHEIFVERGEINTQALLYYTLTTSKEAASRKMIFVEK